MLFLCFAFISPQYATHRNPPTHTHSLSLLSPLSSLSLHHLSHPQLPYTYPIHLSSLSAPLPLILLSSSNLKFSIISRQNYIQMAVQAQYPSNVLLLNRNVQEGNNLLENNYSFLDQSQMMFSNGVGSNPRKRGRESPNTIINHPFSIQLNPPQFMDLSQLQTHQPNAVSTGLRLAFGEQQRQQQSQPPQQRKHQQLQQQQQQNLSPQSSVLWSLLSEDLATQIRQQREEIEQFLQAQGEQLRRTLADKRQRQFRALLNAAEETAARKLREKEAEVDKAARRNAELEARAAQLTAQAHAWQARARAQEAAAAALREQLQQAIVTGARRQDEWGEEVGGGGEAEDAESVCGDPERVPAASGPSCKACRRRVASVVLLPCRHLCLCSGCGALAESCPLCLAVRESSVEILLS